MYLHGEFYVAAIFLLNLCMSELHNLESHQSFPSCGASDTYVQSMSQLFQTSILSFDPSWHLLVQRVHADVFLRSNGRFGLSRFNSVHYILHVFLECFLQARALATLLIPETLKEIWARSSLLHDFSTGFAAPPV